MKRGRPLVAAIERRKRKMQFHPDEVRAKIQATLLVQRLHNHIMGTLEKPLDMSQVRAIDILLKKVVPDLTRTLISADVNVKYVAELPPVLSREEWLKKYGNDGPKLIEGTVVSGGENGGNGKLQ